MFYNEQGLGPAEISLIEYKSSMVASAGETDREFKHYNLKLYNILLYFIV